MNEQRPSKPNLGPGTVLACGCYLRPDDAEPRFWFCNSHGGGSANSHAVRCLLRAADEPPAALHDPRFKDAAEQCAMMCAWKGGGPCILDDCPRRAVQPPAAPADILAAAARVENELSLYNEDDGMSRDLRTLVAAVRGSSVTKSPVQAFEALREAAHTACDAGRHAWSGPFCLICQATRTWCAQCDGVYYTADGLPCTTCNAMGETPRAAPETSAALDRTQGGLLPEGKTYFVGETPEGQS